jgi:hypothetical protein
MSEAQKESLRLAREKAVLYRLQLKEEKEKMGIKDDKKLNKTQLKLLKLKEKIEPSVVVEEEILKEVIPIEEVIPIKEPIKEVIPIKEPIDKPIDAYSAFPNGNDKKVVVEENKVIIKPSIFRNADGFYCI